MIDSDYRGEVKVLLFNQSPDVAFQVNEGDRIAQLIIEKYTPTQLVEVETLSETVRGEGGFGSTGYGVDIGKKRHPNGTAQEVFRSASTEVPEASLKNSTATANTTQVAE